MIAPAARTCGAVRFWNFRLVEWFEDMRIELFNLQEDLSEQHDLATALPQQAEALRTRLHRWRREVGAQTMTLNPALQTAPPAGKK